MLVMVDGENKPASLGWQAILDELGANQK